MLRPTTFPKTILAATSTRKGGVGEGAFATLNTAYHAGDDVRAVAENRKRLFSRIDAPLSRAVFLQQTHETHIAIADERVAGCGAHGDGNALPATDGVITMTRMLPIVVQTADCLPVVIADKDAGYVAVLHCGWRSLAGGIITNACTLIRAKGFAPERAIVWLSACIGETSFQVGEEVACAFSSPIKRGDGYYVNLRAEAKRILIREGVRDDAIEASGDDTFRDSDRFFSYRRDGKETGRMATVAMLQQKA